MFLSGFVVIKSPQATSRARFITAGEVRPTTTLRDPPANAGYAEKALATDPLLRGRLRHPESGSSLLLPIREVRPLARAA
jgi:hypothetical protein